MNIYITTVQRFCSKLLLILFPFAALAAGDHSEHTAETVCNFPTLQCAQAPSAKFDSRGRLWSAWAFGGHIYVNYSDDKGVSYSQPISINPVPENISARGENRPKIAFDKGEGIYISWTTALEKKYTGNVRFSSSSDYGVNFTTPVTVNDNRDLIGHRFDTMQVSDDGHVYLAWVDKRDRERVRASGGKYRGAAIYYSWRNPDELNFQPNIKIIDHSCECCRVTMDLDENQLPVVMWRNIYGDNIRDHAITSFTSNSQFSVPQRATREQWKIDGCPHHGPDIRVEDGTYHAVWFNNAEEKHGLFYAFSTDKGETFSVPYNFGNYSQRASHPNVLALDNSIYLAWKEFDGEQVNMMINRSGDRGESWGVPTKVATLSGNVDYPQLLQYENTPYLFFKTDHSGFQLIPLGDLNVEK